MQIRHDTERARAESDYHRELAAAEARRAQALQKNSDTLESLSLIGQEITAQLDATAIFAALDRHVHRLLDATHFSIFLMASDGLHLECQFGVEDRKPLPFLRVALNNSTSNAARCARDRREVVRQLERAEQDDPNLIPGTLPSLSAMFAPLTVGDRLLGVMSIQSPLANAYQERELQVFRSLCSYAAIGLDNAFAYRRIAETLKSLREAQSELMDKNAQLEIAYREQKTFSLTDPLTGMHNRRYLTEQLNARESARKERVSLERRITDRPAPAEREPILLFFMIDLDHFKLVNDLYGHVAGDKVLIALRQRLEQIARAGDYLIRWGGEEFLLVSKALDRDNAPAIAERLKHAVADTAFDLGDGVRLQKTCSIGFSSFPFSDSSTSDLTWSQVVDVADRALYMAKTAGRNRWTGLMASPGQNIENLYFKLSNQLTESIAIGEVVLLSGTDDSAEGNVTGRP